MIRLKDKDGIEHDCDNLAMVVEFDIWNEYKIDTDYQAYFVIEGSTYDNPTKTFIIKSSCDYYEIADEFIDLKQKLLLSQPTIDDILSRHQKKEVYALCREN